MNPQAETPEQACPSAPQHQNYVVCMKWGLKYGSEYVNRLWAMVKRHCHLDHRFVCFTDDTQGINDCIDTMPLPASRLPNRPVSEAWRKLSLFQQNIGISGVCLFLDLDVVITSSLEPFF